MTPITPTYAWNGRPAVQPHIDAIVLHHAAAPSLSPERLHETHLANGWAGIGYHYYVRKDGSVYRGRPEAWVGAHAGAKSGYNNHSLGVCFEGDYETETAMPAAQLAAGIALVADLRRRYGRLQLLKHSYLTPTACPGRFFPFDSFLTGGEAMRDTTALVGGVSVPAKLIDDRTYVELRPMVDAIKAALIDKTSAIEVAWDPAAKQAEVKL